MDRVKRIWYLSPMRAAKVQASLRGSHWTFAARSYKQWIKRNLQTESQICGPSEWLGMRSWNLSWRNARRHKFAWGGSNEICHSQISLHKFDVKDCFKERFNIENKLVSYENIFRYNQPQKWAASWKNQNKMTCPVWSRVFAVCLKKFWVLKYP